MSIKLRRFSNQKSFSDWDQIRDLVNDQLPKGVIKVRKLRGSDDGKSYQVVKVYKDNKESEPITIKIDGKSALENYNKATGDRIKNQLPSDSNDKISALKEKQILIRSGIDKKFLVPGKLSREDSEKYEDQVLSKLKDDPKFICTLADSGEILKDKDDYDLSKLDDDTLVKLLDALIEGGYNIKKYGFWQSREPSQVIAKNIAKSIKTPGLLDDFVDSGISIEGSEPGLSAGKLKELYNKGKIDGLFLADNPSADSDLINEAFKEESDITVRSNLATSAKLSPKLLNNFVIKNLDHDNINSRTWMKILCNPNLTSDTIEKLINSNNDYYDLLDNKNLTEDHLFMMLNNIKKSDWITKYKMIEHPNASRKLLDKLANDDNSEVRERAKKRIEELG